MIEVYTDAATRGNPGESGAGIYIKTNGEHYDYSIALGVLTNHEAEFHAVIKALDIIRDEFPIDILSFHTDSRIVYDVVDRHYTKNSVFKPLLQDIETRIQPFPHFFIKWIPEKQNKHADQLAKHALFQ